MPEDHNPSTSNWGLRSLELDKTALANESVSLRSCEVRFKNGAERSIPKDGSVDPIHIRDVLTVRDSLIVYLAIPTPSSGQSKVEGASDLVLSVGRKNELESELKESRGASWAHSLGSRRAQARLILSGQDHTGFEISPLCRIKRVSTWIPPRIDSTYIPPLLYIDAWPELVQELRSLFDAIRVALNRLYQGLADSDRTLGALSAGDATAVLEPERTIEELGQRREERQDGVERLSKLSALNRVTSCLEAIIYLRGVPPAAVHAQLCRLAFQLEFVHPGRGSLDLPAYDHEDIGRCFRVLIEIVKNRLSTRPVKASVERTAGQVIELKRRAPIIGRCPGAQGTAFLKVANGDRSGQIIGLEAERVIIGRSPEVCHIVLISPEISRRHAEIYRKGMDFWLADLDSRNSTTVNYTKVIPGIGHRLSPGDLINICGAEFLFCPHPDANEFEEIEEIAVVTRPETQSAVLRSFDLSTELSIGAAASKTLDSLVELFPKSQKLFLGLIDPWTDQLISAACKYQSAGGPVVTANVPLEQVPMKLSRSIVNHVLEQKKAVLCHDVDSDLDFPTTASIADLTYRSVICVPLLSSDQGALGIIQVETTAPTPFVQEDLELVVAVASQAAIAIERLQSQSQRLRAECHMRECRILPESLEPDFTPLAHVAAPESIRRHTDISFPARVHVAKTYNLRVQIIPAEEALPTGEIKEFAKPHAHDVTMSLLVSKPATPEEPPPDIRLTVDVAAENFEIDGPASAEIVVPLLHKSPAATFRLRGKEIGPGRVMIDFVQAGRPVGSVDLSPEVVAVDNEDASDRAATERELNLGAGPGLDSPDLVIKVFEHRLAGQPGRLHFVISSTDRRLKDLPVLDGDLGMKDLNTEVADWVENQLRTLASLACQPGVAVEQVTATLARVGCNLFEQLLPKTLQDMCWTFRQRGIRKVLILSDEPHIPWELIRPYRTDPVAGELIAEDVFWGEAFALTRWLRGRPPVQRFSFNRIFAMAQGGTAPQSGSPEAARDMVPLVGKTAGDALPEDRPARSELESAAEELALLRSLEASGSHVRVLPARRFELIDAFERGGFDLLHLIGHGAFGGTFAADASAVWMEDGEFRVGELSTRIVGAMRGASPLIFFNSCHSGRTGFSLASLGSWGARLVELGCGGFVGTLWPVTDQAAFAFAQVFYELMSQGLPIGEVMLTARHRVRVRFPNDPTWLAYCCFADPWARIEK
jgi:predicted component of type VI protein secretion system